MRKGLLVFLCISPRRGTAYAEIKPHPPPLPRPIGESPGFPSFFFSFFFGCFLLGAWSGVTLAHFKQNTLCENYSSIMRKGLQSVVFGILSCRIDCLCHGKTATPDMPQNDYIYAENNSGLLFFTWNDFDVWGEGRGVLMHKGSGFLRILVMNVFSLLAAFLLCIWLAGLKAIN